MAKKPYEAAVFQVEQQGREPFHVKATRRERWALEALMAAGPRGCVPIETHRERHGGPFPGNHTRFRIAANITRVTEAAS